MQYLVLGAEGYIGAYLYNRMKEDGLSVIGTRHNEQKKNELLYFDLKRQNIENIMKAVTDQEKTAIFCIAESNIDKCYINYEAAYQLNVISTKSVIHKLIQNGFHVVFFSSDNVFDGKSGNYTEESMTSAINEYGKMKEEMENYLLVNEPEACIFRIPKVVSAQKEKKNILSEWENGITHKRIRCIKGNILSLVYIEDVYQACRVSAEKKLCGLYNIAGNQAYSRKELAEKFCDAFGADDVEIIECEIGDFPFKDARRPLNIGMINRKFRTSTGYEFTSVEYVFQKYIQDNQD